MEEVWTVMQTLYRFDSRLQLFATLGTPAGMQADCSTALRAGPFRLLFAQKSSHANSFDPQSIFNQADPIPQPVSLVQPFDSRAGIP
jgi:hypothetical protein